MKHNFNAIIIGAGSAGLTSAIGLAKVGKRVLLIEKDLMGGDCTNFGCIPSKTLINRAHNYAIAKKAAGETKTLKEYRDSILKDVRDQVLEIRNAESPELLQKHHPNLKILIGTATLKGKYNVSVQGKGKKPMEFSAKNIIIATGSRPKILNIPGLKPEKLLTNKTLFQLEKIPQKMIIIGAGAIGCEMAEAFALLGTRITMIVRNNRILRHEEPEIAEVIEKNLQDLGVEIHHQSTIVSCTNGIAEIKCHKQNAESFCQNDYDYILMGIGRDPNIENLGLEEIGLKTTENGITVDHHYRTSLKNIFAIGDVSTTARFTHIADDQGRHVVKKILFPLAKREDKPIPRVTFLRNEIASVGMHCQEAETKCGHQEIAKITLPFQNLDRAKTDKATDGLAIVTVKRISGRILGASIVGKNAGEIISIFGNAIQHKTSLWKLGRTIYPYPTLGRLIKKIADQFLALTFHNLKKDLKHYTKKHAPKVVAIIFWITIFLFFSSYRDGRSSLEIAREFFDFFANSKYGPFLYILVYALRPLIFFPATLLTLISGALFGFWIGIIYTIIGENLSANFAYLLGRLLGKDIIPPDKSGLLSRWKRRLQENSFVSVLVMRFVYMPFDLTNYGCGVLHVRWRAYALATLIGILPGLITFVSFGASIENVAEFDPSTISFDPLQLVISFALFGSSLLLARWIRKRKKIPATT